MDELKEQYAEADAALTVDNIRIGELDQQAGHSRRQMEEIEAAEAKLEVLRHQATEQGQLAADYEELKRAFSQDASRITSSAASSRCSRRPRRASSARCPAAT